MTRQAGFTLTELMIAVCIASILASVAIPSYARYVNQAKAAELLVNIHQITLGYIDASYDTSNRKPGSYDSPSFTQAPPALSSLDGFYITKHGLELASYVMSNSQYVSTLSPNSKPIIFIKAPTEKSQTILYALDHILQQDHLFIAPNVMMIALSHHFLPVTLQSGKLVSTAQPQAVPNLAPNQVPSQVQAKPTLSPSAIPSQIPTVQNPVTTATSQPIASTVTSIQSSSTSSTSTVTQATFPSQTTPSSTIPADCYRHPGWLKNHLHGC